MALLFAKKGKEEEHIVCLVLSYFAVFYTIDNIT